MSRTNIYLNFVNQTEEAFNYYKSIFRGDFVGGISRMGQAPPKEGQPPLTDEVKNLVMHIDLPILGGVHLMGTDAPQEMGFKVNMGNNIQICLEPDTKEEGKRLFEGLSEGGSVTMPLQDMFWGAYYGACTDKFGVQWMINVTNPPQV